MNASAPTKVFYSDAYLVEDATLETVSKAGLVAANIAGMAGVGLQEPTPATRDELLAIHEPSYVDAVLSGEPRTLAESAGVGRWSPRLRDSVLASSGGMRDATLAAIVSGGNAGSLSSGLHHARRARGSGFCTFNGLALAVKTALDVGVSRVGVLDLDAHFGGGTASILDGRPGVTLADVSVSAFDRWTPTDQNHAALVSDSDEYLDAVRTAVAAVARCELVIYNAGMDPFEHCSTGGLQGITEDMLRARELLVAEALAAVPVVFCLAGGYRGRLAALEEIAELHSFTVAAFASRP